MSYAIKLRVSEAWCWWNGICWYMESERKLYAERGDLSIYIDRQTLELRIEDDAPPCYVATGTGPGAPRIVADVVEVG